jgi:hypothetical protein
MKNDNKKHIIAGLFVAALVGLPCYLKHQDLFAGLWAALTSGIAIAACKEWCDNDYSLAGRFDWRDFLWTVAGAVAIALLILGMHYGKG